MYAVTRGRARVEDGTSICLTEAGRPDDGIALALNGATLAPCLLHYALTSGPLAIERGSSTDRSRLKAVPKP